MSNPKIDFKSIFKAWCNACSVKTVHDNLVRNWNSKTDYTNSIFVGESVLYHVGRELGLNYQNNYYGLDSVFYTEDDWVRDVGENSVWLRRIEIAFEHENNFNHSLYQEVTHLLITKCNWRVIVAYDNVDKQEPIMDYLAKIAEDDIPILVILGDKDEKDQISWRSYIITCGSWTTYE